MLEEDLNITPLKNARDSFSRGLEKLSSDPEDEFVRDSVIQRFEFCYDLMTKFIKRHLKNYSENPSSIDEMSFPDMIREADKKQVLKNNLETWSLYRKQRNITSDTYDESKANAVLAQIPSFLPEINYFITRLEELYEN